MDAANIDHYVEEVLPKYFRKKAADARRRSPDPGLEEKLRRAWQAYQSKPLVLDFSDATHLWYATPDLIKEFPGIDTLDEKSARNISDFCQSPVFDGVREKKDLQIVDWGCGNGLKGIALYNLFKARYLRLIDNEPAVAIAASHCKTEGVRYVPSPTNMDAVSLEKYDSERLHVLLGNTISNFGRGDRLREVAGKIAAQMRVEEYLLVEWTSFPSDHYGGTDGMNFMRHFLRHLLPNISKDKNEDKLIFSAHDDRPSHAPQILCKFTVQDDFTSKVKDDMYVFWKDTVFIPARIQRFKYQDINSFFTEAGLVRVKLREEEIPHELGQAHLGPQMRAVYHETKGAYHYALFQKEREQDTTISLRKATKWSAACLLLGVLAGRYGLQVLDSKPSPPQTIIQCSELRPISGFLGDAVDQRQHYQLVCPSDEKVNGIPKVEYIPLPLNRRVTKQSSLSEPWVRLLFHEGSKTYELQVSKEKEIYLKERGIIP